MVRQTTVPPYSSTSVPELWRRPYSLPLFFRAILSSRFFQRTAAKFTFSLHLHNVSCFLYITYVNFVYITRIIYISDTSPTSFTIYILYVTFFYVTYITYIIYANFIYITYIAYIIYMICMFYTRVIAQELLHRSCYTGVFFTEVVMQEKLPGDLLASELLQNSYTSQVLLNFSLLAAGAARHWLTKRDLLGRLCMLGAKTHGGTCGDRPCRTRKRVVTCEFCLPGNDPLWT